MGPPFLNLNFDFILKVFYLLHISTSDKAIFYYSDTILINGFPLGSVVKNLPANVSDAEHVGSIPGLGRYTLEMGKATHSSILAWKIPRTV